MFRAHIGSCRVYIGLLPKVISGFRLEVLPNQLFALASATFTPRFSLLNSIWKSQFKLHEISRDGDNRHGLGFEGW
jgi:hypothetical protein